jgi:predicted Rossmann fold flavoprotein
MPDSTAYGSRTSFSTVPPAETDVVVVGGGAAGLMCAIEAGKRGRRVVVIEHNPRIACKILISGGGRCNFTNLHTGPENFVSRNRHFAKSALARYQPRDFLRLVERHGIPYHEKTLGQMFCDRSASEISALLEAECAAAGVRIETGCAVRNVNREPAVGRYRIDTECGAWRAASLAIATGGLSIPKMGATALGYRLARQFGLKIVDCRPALVPLTFARADREAYSALAGVAADVVASVDGQRFREKMLFTHRGLSGPAILQASSYWKPGETLQIDLLPEIDLIAVLREARTTGDRAELRTAMSRFLPKRLADRWLELRAGTLPGTKPLAALGDREIQAVSSAVHRWSLQPAGTEGYEKAEVTAGGVDTAELSSRTMEAKKAPGLYFVGEVLDVTGQLGGFNFQWAWASGYSAGQVV